MKPSAQQPRRFTDLENPRRPLAKHLPVLLASRVRGSSRRITTMMASSTARSTNIRVIDRRATRFGCSALGFSCDTS